MLIVSLNPRAQPTHVQFHDHKPSCKHRHHHNHCYSSLALNTPILARATHSINRKPVLSGHGFPTVHPIPVPDTLKATRKKRPRNKGYGEFNTSSDVLRLMDNLGLTVTPDVYASLISDCTDRNDAAGVAVLFNHISGNRNMSNFLIRPRGLSFTRRILIMCMRCGLVDHAHQLFAKLSKKDSVLQCIMIAGLVHNSLYSQALDFFLEMMVEPFSPENTAIMEILISCILKACVHTWNIEVGRIFHGWMIKLGYTKSLLVATAFVDFYGKFRCSRDVNAVFFDQIKTSSSNGGNNRGGGDTVLWTGAIAGNCREQKYDDAISMFKEMGKVGIRKNEFTFSSVIKACGKVRHGRECGQQVHASAIKLGAVDSHVFVQCSLVNMYSNCEMAGDARKVFDMMGCKMRNRSAPCWNAMINGYLENGMSVEAIKVLYQMRDSGLQPQPSLIDRVKIACGSGRR